MRLMFRCNLTLFDEKHISRKIVYRKVFVVFEFKIDTPTQLLLLFDFLISQAFILLHH